MAWGRLPDVSMDTTGHSNDETEEWLKELLQYNREAHGCAVFKAMLVLQVMRNKIGSQHVGPMSGQNRPPCIYPCCCRWGMSTNAQICWGYTFCSSIILPKPFLFQEWPHLLKDDDDAIGVTPWTGQYSSYQEHAHASRE